jgi:hypothetical protein
MTGGITIQLYQLFRVPFGYQGFDPKPYECNVADHRDPAKNAKFLAD